MQFAIIVRVNPVHFSLFLSLSAKLTVTTESLIATEDFSGYFLDTDPFGPVHVNKLSSNLTLTPAGILTGFFPILDIIFTSYFINIYLHNF